MLPRHLWVNHIKLYKFYNLTFSDGCFRMLVCVETSIAVANTDISVYYSGDSIEANAIRNVFSEHATSGSLALSSTKVNMKSRHDNL